MAIDDGDFHDHAAETWELACRHISLFLWWAAERGLASERHDPEEVRRAPTDHFDSFCDGGLREEDLTERGNMFASREYKAYLNEVSAYARTLGVGSYEIPESEATTTHFFAWLDGRLASDPGVDAPAAVPVERPVAPRLVRREDVLFVEECGDYIRLHTPSASDYLMQLPLSQLEERWQHAGFVRVHPKYLLAVSAVLELRSGPTGGLVAHTEVGDVPVSRRRERELRERLGEAATTSRGELDSQ